MIQRLESCPLLHFRVERTSGEAEEGEELGEATGLIDAVGKDDGTAGVPSEEVVEVGVFMCAYTLNMAELQAGG